MSDPKRPTNRPIPYFSAGRAVVRGAEFHDTGFHAICYAFYEPLHVSVGSVLSLNVLFKSKGISYRCTGIRGKHNSSPVHPRRLQLH